MKQREIFALVFLAATAIWSVGYTLYAGLQFSPVLCVAGLLLSVFAVPADTLYNKYGAPGRATAVGVGIVLALVMTVIIRGVEHRMTSMFIGFGPGAIAFVMLSRHLITGNPTNGEGIG